MTLPVTELLRACVLKLEKINFRLVQPAGPWSGDADARERASPLSLSRRLTLLFKLLPYMLPLAVVYFAEYLINQSVDPVFRYADEKLVKVDDQYAFLQLIYQIGVFISRSSVNVYRLKSVWALQVPAILQVTNAVFLSLAAVYHWLPSFWLVVLVALWEGIMGGSIYVNCFYLVSEKFSGRARE